jgi:hypothetical protein
MLLHHGTNIMYVTMEKYKALCHGDKIGTKEALNQRQQK